MATFLVALWPVSIRLHDSSIHTAALFGGAVAALVGVTFVAYSELWAGLIVVVHLVALLGIGAEHEDAVGLES